MAARASSSSTSPGRPLTPTAPTRVSPSNAATPPLKNVKNGSSLPVRPDRRRPSPRARRSKSRPSEPPYTPSAARSGACPERPRPSSRPRPVRRPFPRRTRRRPRGPREPRSRRSPGPIQLHEPIAELGSVPCASCAAPAIAAPGGRALTIRGTAYPVLLPTIRDPRLHLAAVILSLQALGQIAFDFRVSIAQILISLATCAVIESGIAFFRQHLIMWPASALITGNGVSFILRVPGHPARRLVEHERLVDLRRHRSRLDPLQACDQAGRAAHLQPLELRAGPLLPRARRESRRAARLLVGPDGRVDGCRAGDHRRRRLRDPRAGSSCCTSRSPSG